MRIDIEKLTREVWPQFEFKFERINKEYYLDLKNWPGCEVKGIIINNELSYWDTLMAIEKALKAAGISDFKEKVERWLKN